LAFLVEAVHRAVHAPDPLTFRADDAETAVQDGAADRGDDVLRLRADDQRIIRCKNCIDTGTEIDDRAGAGVLDMVITIAQRDLQIDDVGPDGVV